MIFKIIILIKIITKNLNRSSDVTIMTKNYIKKFITKNDNKKL
jgi:hypothetical protein